MAGVTAGASTFGQRILVVGAGALGGITTALLWERWMGRGPFRGPAVDAPILALTTNAAIADSVAKRGFVLGGMDDSRAVPAPIATSLGSGTRPFDWVILAVQPPQVEEAARDVSARLGPSGKVVCFQNGLCEERVARAARIDKHRVVGAVVGWGASMPEPGRYIRTARGAFTLGLLEDHAGQSAALEGLARVLDAVAPTRITDNLLGARFSKLTVNCAISTLGTIGGGTLGAVMLHRIARRLGLEIMSEVVAVAQAANVKLEKIGGLDLDRLVLTDEERRSSGSPSLALKHSLLLAVGARYRRMRSSMLAAIERGRIPAVDFLNGEVVERGEKLGVATPVNREAQRMVHEIAHGRLKPGIHALRLLYDRIERPS